MVSILASLGMVGYTKAKENTYDKEAVTNLKIMQAGQQSYRMTMSTYYPPSGSVSDITAINNNLGVFIVGNELQKAWNYTVSSTGCMQAKRNGYDNRTWYLLANNTGADPSSGTCP